MSAGFETFPTVIAEIERLCRQGRSGKIFLTSEANHTASLGLDDGRVVSVHYRIRRGVRALASLSTIGRVRPVFDESAEVVPDPDLPPSEEVLARLRGADDAPAAPVAPATTRLGAPTGGDLSPRVRSVLEEVLVDHIGPMASILCGSALAGVGTLDDALDALRSRLPDPVQSAQFERDVRARLGR